MNWLSTWGPSLLAAVVATIMAAVFTWWFGIRTAHERRRGIRALVSQELMDNYAMLQSLRNDLSHFVESGAGQEEAAAFAAIALMIHPPVRQQSRWSLPDVGESLSLNELAQISGWYIRLDTLVHDYERIIDVMRYTLPGGMEDAVRMGPFAKSVGESMLRLLKPLVVDVDQLLSKPPVLPSSRFHWPSTGMGQVQQAQAGNLH